MIDAHAPSPLAPARPAPSLGPAPGAWPEPLPERPRPTADMAAGTPGPGLTPFATAVIATAAVVAAVALFGAAFLMGPALLMALLALVLATAALPVVDALARVMPRQVAALLVLAAGMVAVLAAIAFAVPNLTVQFGLLLEHLPARCQALKTWAGGAGGGLARQVVAGVLPVDCTALIASLPKRVAAWRSLVWAENTLWSVLVVGAMAYWWLLERSDLLMRLTLLLRPGLRERTRAFVAEAEVRLGAFIRGQLIVCALVGVVTFAAYFIMGLPTALALGGLAAVAELVPILGPLVVAAAAVVTAPHAWLAIIAVALVVRVLVDYAVTPLVMGRAVGLNALLVLASLVALTKFGGVLGAMVAVPFAAIVQLAVDRWILNAPVDRTAAGRDRLSALRYQARVLGTSARKLARRRARQPQIVELEEEVELIAEGLTTGLSPVSPI